MIVAFYKVFQGSEFFQASLASIYKHVDKIVIVSSDKNWFGEPGNDCEAEAREFMRKFDIDKKIVLLTGTWTNQDDQQDYGWNYIRKNITQSKDDFVQIIDSDEVWTDELYEKAKKVMRDNPNYITYACHSIVYFKYANWRITNFDPAYLLTFVRASVDKFRGSRGAALYTSGTWRDCNEFYFHHMNMVRKQEEIVFAKVKSSLEGDKVRGTDFNVWRKKWSDPLSSSNLHMTYGCEKNWQACREMDESEIPDIIKNSKYYKSLKAPSSTNETRAKINASNKRKVRALLFDLDGTLYDTPTMHWQALNKALKNYGYPEISFDDQKAKYLSMSTTEKMKIIGVTEKDFEVVKDLKDQYFYEITERHEWQDYAKAIVSHFKSGGYKVYIVSNNNAEYVKRIAGFLGILNIVDGMQTGDTVEHKKPAPELYEKVINANMLTVLECVAFEDSQDGLTAARSAGLDVMQITDKNRGRISDIEEFIKAVQ